MKVTVRSAAIFSEMVVDDSEVVLFNQSVDLLESVGVEVTKLLRGPL